MNTNIFRHFYDYHFAENRKLWDNYILQLSPDQFTQAVNYSHGSVRNQIVHLVSVEDTWFIGLRCEPIPQPLDPADFSHRKILRAHWDEVERRMRGYLATFCPPVHRSARAL